MTQLKETEQIHESEEYKNMYAEYQKQVAEEQKKAPKQEHNHADGCGCGHDHGPQTASTDT